MVYHTHGGRVVPNAKPQDMRQYRFWFDQNLGVWCIEPHGVPGQMLQTPKLILDELDAVSVDGPAMVCLAELLAHGATMRLDAGTGIVTAKHARLRLLRKFNQEIVLHASADSKAVAAMNGMN